MARISYRDFHRRVFGDFRPRISRGIQKLIEAFLLGLMAGGAIFYGLIQMWGG